MPAPFAKWNPTRMIWESDQMDLFSGRSVPYVAIWPANGMTRNGFAYELPMWDSRINVPVSSSSPSLPTPTSRDHKGPGNKPGRMRAGRPRKEGDDLLPDVVIKMSPTPTAVPYGNNRSPTPGATVRPSLDGLMRMLPTPRSTDGHDSMTAPAARRHVADGNGTLSEVLGTELFPE